MKKMCFSERFGLHDAVLEGRKTHTRRLIPQSTLAKVEAFQQEYYEATLDRLDGIELLEQYYNVEKRGKLPFKVGDIDTFERMAAEFNQMVRKYVNPEKEER